MMVPDAKDKPPSFFSIAIYRHHTMAKKKKKRKPRNAFVLVMLQRHPNWVSRMRDRRLRRSKDKRNHWSNDYDLV